MHTNVNTHLHKYKYKPVSRGIEFAPMLCMQANKYEILYQIPLKCLIQNIINIVWRSLCTIEPMVSIATRLDLVQRGFDARWYHHLVVKIWKLKTESHNIGLIWKQKYWSESENLNIDQNLKTESHDIGLIWMMRSGCLVATSLPQRLPPPIEQNLMRIQIQIQKD